MLLVEGGFFMSGLFCREDIPYDAMGDYSDFDFDEGREEETCRGQDREKAGSKINKNSSE